jgi:hypothetical protein
MLHVGHVAAGAAAATTAAAAASTRQVLLYVEDVLRLCKLLVQQRQHTTLSHLQGREMNFVLNVTMNAADTDAAGCTARLG